MSNKSVDVATGGGVLSDHDWTVLAKLLKFSERESAIVKLVFDDYCDCEIAEQLGMSRHTVNTHIGRLYRKLSVHSRVQLVVTVFSEYLAALSAANAKKPR